SGGPAAPEAWPGRFSDNKPRRAGTIGDMTFLSTTTDAIRLADSGDRPLSEDLLRYTPRGGKSEIPVSAAINITHEKIEFEGDRKFKAHSPGDRVFLDLVTLEGEMRLKNFEKAAAELVIVVTVPGKPIEASDDGQRAADSSKLQLLDRAGTI